MKRSGLSWSTWFNKKTIVQQEPAFNCCNEPTLYECDVHGKEGFVKMNLCKNHIKKMAEAGFWVAL